MAGGVDLVTGGTDNHLLLVDLRPKGLKGNQVEQALERAGITCNKNGIPFDPEKPTITSGIRLGTPAGTTRGFGVHEFRDIGRLIVEVFDALRESPEGHTATEQRVRREIFALCERFPIYWTFKPFRSLSDEYSSRRQHHHRRPEHIEVRALGVRGHEKGQRDRGELHRVGVGELPEDGRQHRGNEADDSRIRRRS